MLKVYLDHYLARLGVDSRARAWLRSFRFRVYMATFCLTLVIISVSLFAVLHDYQMRRNAVDLNKLQNELEAKNADSTENDSKKNHLGDTIDDKRFRNINHSGRQPLIADRTVLRSNSDLESTMIEIRSATRIISDELREQYPFHRCVKYIQSSVRGTELNESKDIANYCKVIVIDYILESSHRIPSTKLPFRSLFIMRPTPQTKNNDGIEKETILPDMFQDRVNKPTEPSISNTLPVKRLISEYCARICAKNSSLGGQICHCDSPPLLGEVPAQF